MTVTSEEVVAAIASLVSPRVRELEAENEQLRAQVAALQNSELNGQVDRMRTERDLAIVAEREKQKELAEERRLRKEAEREAALAAEAVVP